MKADELTLLQITPAEAEQAGLRGLYERSFPFEERRPWNSMNRQTEEFAMLGVKYDGKFTGMVNLWRFEGEIAYIEHFMIDEKYRGMGMGAATLEIVRAMASPLPIVLEVEPEDVSEIAARRIRFYRRNGYVDFPDYPYRQPPYVEGNSPLRLTLMASDSTINTDEAARRLYASVYSRDTF